MGWKDCLRVWEENEHRCDKVNDKKRALDESPVFLKEWKLNLRKKETIGANLGEICCFLFSK